MSKQADELARKIAAEFPGDFTFANWDGSDGEWDEKKIATVAHILEPHLKGEQRAIASKLITPAAIDDLRQTISFMMSQIETLARRAFSEDAQGWLEKCDAYNAGKQALVRLDKLRLGSGRKRNE